MTPRVFLPSCVWAGLLCGCGPIRPIPDSGAARFSSADPAITGLSVECDPAQDRWKIALRTDAWVGTARLWMGRGVPGLEQHALDVNVSSASATWDCWEASINVAVDVDNPGSDSRYSCRSVDTLHMLLAVSDEADQQWTDCRRWGPQDPFWSEAAGVPECETVVESAWTEESTRFETGDVSRCP